jgi:hypothetical protein
MTSATLTPSEPFRAHATISTSPGKQLFGLSGLVAEEIIM